MCGMLIKSVSIVFEDPDSLKNSDIKRSSFTLFKTFAQKYENATSKPVQRSLLQFIREEHLAEPVADFLKDLCDEGCTDLVDNILRQMLKYYDVLEERFRDNKSYVRARLLQLISKLTELVGVTCCNLESNARYCRRPSNVRKNAVKLLGKFVETAPCLEYAFFPVDEGKLSLALFTERLAGVKHLFKTKFPSEYLRAIQELLDEEDTAQWMEEENEIQVPDETNVDAEAVKSLRRMLVHYYNGVKYLKLFQKAMPVLCELMASNTKTEVVECMKFISTAYQHNIDGARDAAKLMIHKIWDKEAEDDKNGVRETLIRCYGDMFLNPKPDPLHQPDEVIALSLIALSQEMNLAELTSYEALIGAMTTKGMISDSVVKLCWTIFTSKRKETPAFRRRGALAILSMIGKANKNVIAEKKDIIMNYGLGDHAKNDLLLARYACVALQQLGTFKREKGSIKAAPSRYPMNDTLFLRLSLLITLPCNSYLWFGFAEQAINTIYLLSEHPDIISTQIINTISERVFKSEVDRVSESMMTSLTLNDTPSADASVAPAAEPSGLETSEQPEATSEAETSENMTDAFEMSKLCFLVGHVAIKQIEHLENIEAECKRRKGRDEKTKSAGAKSGDELDQVTGANEDDLADALLLVREKELLYGHNSVLAVFGPIVEHVCRHNIVYNVMSTLALCKLMCVSSEFCDQNLQLLFTILEKSSNPIIRSNVIIGLGDMTVSFNSLIDQNISYLYNRLSDTDLTVKKNALMVLTHLILNGMVKVKGQISEMAKCLEDPDKRISDLAKLFFTELSTKDNAIYNNLPDIISNLSHKDSGVKEEEYRSIMKFLFDFIKKDKLNDAIVEKLGLRFKTAEEPRLWRDIGFCLSLLPFTSEKSIKRLIDALPSYQDKLHEDMLYKYLEDILAKTVDDFDAKVKELRAKCVENQRAAENAAATKNPAAGKSVTHLSEEMAALSLSNEDRKELEVQSDGEDQEEDFEEEEDETTKNKAANI
ncbi:Condensin complex subunit [Blyttiomyces sp. JEL0837]|nr:Condensin complex subunit [Blyttiomyces sp. JEL0837]